MQSVMGAVSALPLLLHMAHGLDEVNKIRKELNWISIFALKSFHNSLPCLLFVSTADEVCSQVLNAFVITFQH